MLQQSNNLFINKMITLNQTMNSFSAYSEVPQVNNLRWKTLHKKGNVLKDTCHWVKCKDFFNDSLAFNKNGVEFFMYSFQNNTPMNKEGMYFLLTHLVEKSLFLHNLSVLNQQLNLDVEATIKTVDVVGLTKNDIVLLTPPEVWKNTYILSLTTLLIRLCNYEYTFHSWDDFFTEAAMSVDGAIGNSTQKFVQKQGFNVPEKYQKYWYYAGETYNSDADLQKSYIHNTGCEGWSRAMGAI
jgi:hypothetical protein